MSLVFPSIGLLLFLSFIKGARLHIRKYMNDPNTFPTLAALFLIGQNFTIFVIILDCFAIHEDKTSHTSMEKLKHYQHIILIVNLVIECFFCYFAIVIVLILSITHCISSKYESSKETFITILFHLFCWPIFCKNKVKYKEARLWLFMIGFIPPL